MNTSTFKPLTLALFLICAASAPVFADPESEKIEAAVRQAHVVNKNYPLHAVISGREATILTRRHPKATDDDLRIDGVLVTKAVIDSFPSNIDRVKVLFRDEDATSGKSVELTAADIKEYGIGAMDAKKFLATIVVTKVGGDEELNQSRLTAAERKLTVSAGPYDEERLLLMDRINTLRRKGTGVTPFETMFAQIETLAKAGAPVPVKEAMRVLADKLAQQEDLVRQANRTGSGRGIKVVSTSRTATAGQDSSNVSVATPNLVRADNDNELRLLLLQYEKSLFRHRSDPASCAYYQRKMSDIQTEKNNGASSGKVKNLLGSLVDEMNHACGGGPIGGSRGGAGNRSFNPGQGEREPPGEDDKNDREQENWGAGRGPR